MVDARVYHERTNHVLEELRTNEFSLDFENKPTPYKTYVDLAHVDPDGDPSPPEVPALEAIDTPDANGDADSGIPDCYTLCRYATGVTKTIERRGERIDFRAASCTGKLYHVDLYVVCGDLPEFDPGVYHYDPNTDGFDVLRKGDYRGVLATASDHQSSIVDAPVTFVVTSQWWRNAWKYRNRTYRHAFWDSGTILANLLAVAHAAGHRSTLVTGFAAEPVVDLLGLDVDEEAPLELVPVGYGDPVSDAPSIEPIDPEEAPLSPDPVDYPLIPDVWRQSTLQDGGAVRAWLAGFADADLESVGRHGVGDGTGFDLKPVDADTASARPIGNTIERRGSLREWPHEPITDRMLATVLDRALGPVPLDCFEERDRAGGLRGLVDYYCLVHAVDGIPPGAYQYHPEDGMLERFGDTDRSTAGEIALGQSVVGDAAVNVYAMADVDKVVETFGNRGYRVAQLEAGLALGRLYLATYAHRRLGGRGFTFLDERVTDHLSPRTANQAPMTLFAFGNRPK